MKIPGIFETSNRQWDCNGGIIGLSPDSMNEVHEGYDSVSYREPEFDPPEGYEDKRLTREERCELADFMIALWSKWRDQTFTKLSALTRGDMLAMPDDAMVYLACSFVSHPPIVYTGRISVEVARGIVDKDPEFLSKIFRIEEGTQ